MDDPAKPLDLGFSPEEAAILQMRADLMAKLRKTITARKLTQAKAAQLLGVSPSRVSDLVRGKWEKSSLEMLITLATSTRHVPRGVRRGGSGEWGCVPSPSGAVLPWSVCLGAGGEAVHGRKEETGHRWKGTVWVEGDDFE
jgi:predicted XRE-type DNA-binding protein